MQPEQILSSDLLDILFADRNKSYGAYPLRKGYNKRLTIALFVTGIIVTLSLSGFYLSGKAELPNYHAIIDTEVTLRDIKEPEPPAPPPPPPPPAPPVATVRNVTPVIVIDEQADAPPPAVEELDHAISGLINQEGIDPSDIVAPPVHVNNSVIETPGSTSENEKLIPVEIESTYPGGMSAWKRFLIRTLNYPGEARQNEIQGRVTVKFIVDAEGKVSNIEAVAGPEELKSEAIRVISKSGKWIPAVQNGYHVKSVKFQQIIFTLQNE
ncbi:MAG: energy transducer TonB [Chitinophagaceae bacterium]|nr:energy transducer TonB [Chitinophagaceae bacterium]